MGVQSGSFLPAHTQYVIDGFASAAFALGLYMAAGVLVYNDGFVLAVGTLDGSLLLCGDGVTRSPDLYDHLWGWAGRLGSHQLHTSNR